MHNVMLKCTVVEPPSSGSSPCPQSRTYPPQGSSPGSYHRPGKQLRDSWCISDTHTHTVLLTISDWPAFVTETLQQYSY